MAFSDRFASPGGDAKSFAAKVSGDSKALRTPDEMLVAAGVLEAAQEKYGPPRMMLTDKAIESFAIGDRPMGPDDYSRLIQAAVQYVRNEAVYAAAEKSGVNTEALRTENKRQLNESAGQMMGNDGQSFATFVDTKLQGQLHSRGVNE